MQDQNKRRVEQPYNYIWGSRVEKTSKTTNERQVHSPVDKCFPIDISKEGSGGKMGRGRAYSAAAENAIGDTLREKRGKNIRQVCIVHSFAEEVSGMILPVLRMVKQSMPGLPYGCSLREKLIKETLHTTPRMSFTSQRYTSSQI